MPTNGYASRFPPIPRVPPPVFPGYPVPVPGGRVPPFELCQPFPECVVPGGRITGWFGEPRPLMPMENLELRRNVVVAVATLLLLYSVAVYFGRRR